MDIETKEKLVEASQKLQEVSFKYLINKLSSFAPEETQFCLNLYESLYDKKFELREES